MAKCSECGFLASRNKETKILEETEPTTRYDGLASKGYDAPICLVRACNLWEKCGIREGVIPFGNPIVKDVLNKGQDCKQWVKWQQGFTPKEHREMIDREAMLEWQANREREDREFREREHRSNKWFRVIELGLVVLTIITMFVVAFISRGGKPTINIITPNPTGFTIEQKP